MHTAIVTGATKGIGHAIARAIVKDGGRAMITGRDAAGVKTAVASLASVARDAAHVGGAAVDVRDRRHMEKLVADTVARFGSFDVLVNNAGVGAFGNVADMSDEDWDRVIDTNLTGVFYTTRAAIPALRRSTTSWIINIASLAGRNYFPKGAAYCASKAALVAFSESLMQEVRADGIRVSVVMPGSVDTEFSGPSATGGDESWKLTPDDVAEVVMDLLRHPARSLPSKVEIRPAKTS